MWSFANTIVPIPASDPIALDVHEVNEAKTQRIILDKVKEHLIPHLAKKKMAKEMWDALKSLYEAKNGNRKMLSGTSSIVIGWPKERVWPPTSPGFHR